MAHLYPHLRIHQVFGASTDVGKTIFTTALCRASASRSSAKSNRSLPGNLSKSVNYLKPISTGNPQQADIRHFLRFVGPHQHTVGATCLYQLDDPVSPHLAVELAASKPQKPQQNQEYTQHTFVQRISGHISSLAQNCPPDSSLYVETAGGVHSPTLSGISQVEAYRALRLPTVLIGDSRLGGISTTIAAYESLLLRGFTVDAVLLFHDSYYQNHVYLANYFRQQPRVHSDDDLGGGMMVVDIPKPPEQVSWDTEEDFRRLEAYYAALTGEKIPLDSSSSPTTMSLVLDHLKRRHHARLDNLASMRQRTLDTIWWPFTQHGLVKDANSVTVIDSASGDHFITLAPESIHQPPSLAHDAREFESSSTKPTASPSSLFKSEFDGSGSWWTQSAGHANPALTMPTAYAAGRYGHVIFPLATHGPALRLAERLLSRSAPAGSPQSGSDDSLVAPGKGWASKVFFSDNGSTGVEVALKMALRAAAIRYPIKPPLQRELGVIGISGSYHGDTIGAMDASEGGVYNSAVEWHRARGFWFRPPELGVKDGEVIVSVPWIKDESTPLYSGEPLNKAIQNVYDVSIRLKTPLAQLYRDHINATLQDLVQRQGRSFGALIIEPILMGAGGMVFVDPLFQRVLIDEVRSRSDLASPHAGDPIWPSDRHNLKKETMGWGGLPVIFDEVFMGLYRLGFLTASSILQTMPDILVLAKILTGGLVPMSATIASESIFQAFLSEKKVDALLHGHSYTAHPMGCAAANASLDFIENTVKSNPEWSLSKAVWSAQHDTLWPSQQKTALIHGKSTDSKSNIWSLWSPSFISAVSRSPAVDSVMCLGTVLAIKLGDLDSGYQGQSAETFMRRVHVEMTRHQQPSPFGLHFRHLGSVAYLITSFNTTRSVLQVLERAILACI